MSFSYLVDNGTKWWALPVISVVADGVHLLRWVGEKAGMTQQVLDGPRDWGPPPGKVALRRRQRQSLTRKVSRAAETVGPLPAAGTTRKNYVVSSVMPGRAYLPRRTAAWRV
jgi:hypothetical protein